jgi:hypothetical protein
MRVSTPKDSRAQAAHLAASLAQTDPDKERVRTAAVALIGDVVSEYWLTRAFQRLGDAMAPDVGFLSGGDWALKSFAALLWAKTGNPSRVGHRLAAESDVRVRRALAGALAGQAADGTLDGPRESVRALLTTDPSHSVRVAATGGSPVA